jgi:hypothetical protein
VASSAIAFANLGEIHDWRARRPGIRPHGNLNAKAALTQANTVDRLRMQVIRYEFVITLEIVICDVKEERVIARLNPFPQDVD